jgi:hypothetical protein
MNIQQLVAYVNSSYPTLPNTNLPVFFSKEFRSIATALNSVEAVLQSGALGVSVVAATPTTANLPASAAGLFKVTGGAVYLAYNDAGTIKKVALT